MFGFFSKTNLLVALGAVLGSEIVSHIFKKFIIRETARNDMVLNEVIFFPDTKIYKNSFASSYIIDKSSSIHRVLQVISSCQRTLDMCLFLVTLKDITSIVISLISRGVTVRLITDNNNLEVPGSQVNMLRHAGVKVLAPKQAGLMHHKFAVLDGQMVVTGSFNWTSQAVMNNNENVIITSNKQLVDPYLREFKRLWEESPPEMEVWESQWEGGDGDW